MARTMKSQAQRQFASEYSFVRRMHSMGCAGYLTERSHWSPARNMAIRAALTNRQDREIPELSLKHIPHCPRRYKGLPV